MVRELVAFAAPGEGVDVGGVGIVRCQHTVFTINGDFIFNASNSPNGFGHHTFHAPDSESAGAIEVDFILGGTEGFAFVEGFRSAVGGRVSNGSFACAAVGREDISTPVPDVPGVGPGFGVAEVGFGYFTEAVSGIIVEEFGVGFGAVGRSGNGEGFSAVRPSDGCNFILGICDEVS